MIGEGPLPLRDPQDWRGISFPRRDYLPPSYYDKILRPYTFGGVSDLELFRTWCRSLNDANQLLELGPGTGRATKVCLEEHPHSQIRLVDLSPVMLEHCLRRFGAQSIAVEQADAVEFLATTSERYDHAFSLWSLSHSIHQHIEHSGLAVAEKIVDAALTRLFSELVPPGGQVFVIHFDPASHEQSLLLRYRSRIQPFLNPPDVPSFGLIHAAAARLERSGAVRCSVTHYVGDPIVYPTMDAALEASFNFHMEGLFNRRPEFASVLREFEEDLSNCLRPDKTVAVRPGCFVFQVIRALR
jgi:phospholipid N-methyltransferase